MISVLGSATDNRERTNRDFAIFHSLMERRYTNNPKTAFCSVVHDNKNFSFSVIGENKELLQDILDFSQKYFSSLTISPNVTIQLVISPNF